MTPKLRVGFLFDSLLLPAWELTTLERIISSDCAELVLVVVNQTVIGSPSTLTRLWQERDYWLYDIFNGIDEKLFLRNANASALVDASSTIANVPLLEIQPLGQDD